jgi:hypothetical protein
MPININKKGNVENKNRLAKTPSQQRVAADLIKRSVKINRLQ